MAFDNWRRSLRFWWQRVFRGFDDSETWSFDETAAKFILPRLRRFQDVRKGHPTDLTEQQWHDIIDQMVYSFEFYASGQQYQDVSDEEWARVQKGMDLFAEHYSSLWW